MRRHNAKRRSRGLGGLRGSSCSLLLDGLLVSILVLLIVYDYNAKRAACGIDPARVEVPAAAASDPVSTPWPRPIALSIPSPSPSLRDRLSNDGTTAAPCRDSNEFRARRFALDSHPVDDSIRMADTRSGLIVVLSQRNTPGIVVRRNASNEIDGPGGSTNPVGVENDQAGLAGVASRSKGDMHERVEHAGPIESVPVLDARLGRMREVQP